MRHLHICLQMVSPLATGVVGGIQRSARPSTAQRRPPKIKDSTAVSGKAASDSVAVGVMKEGSAPVDSDSDTEAERKTAEAAAEGFGFAARCVVCCPPPWCPTALRPQ